MTSSEIQMLIVGMALGVHLMNFLHWRWDRQDARASAAAARAAAKRAAGDHHLASLRLYQLRNRSRV